MMMTPDGTIDEIVDAAAHADFCISAAAGGGCECARKARKEARHG